MLLHRDVAAVRQADEAARERIAALGVPSQDPVAGYGVAAWKA